MARKVSGEMRQKRFSLGALFVAPHVDVNSGVALQDSRHPALVYEVIAGRIIDAAKKSECDPVRLRDIGLAALPQDRAR